MFIFSFDFCPHYEKLMYNTFMTECDGLVDSLFSASIYCIYFGLNSTMQFLLPFQWNIASWQIWYAKNYLISWFNSKINIDRSTHWNPNKTWNVFEFWVHCRNGKKLLRSNKHSNSFNFGSKSVFFYLHAVNYNFKIPKRQKTFKEYNLKERCNKNENKTLNSNINVLCFYDIVV